jgi:hypothetical protein
MGVMDGKNWIKGEGTCLKMCGAELAVFKSKMIQRPQMSLSTSCSTAESLLNGPRRLCVLMLGMILALPMQ